MDVHYTREHVTPGEARRLSRKPGSSIPILQMKKLKFQVAKTHQMAPSQVNGSFFWVMINWNPPSREYA